MVFDYALGYVGNVLKAGLKHLTRCHHWHRNIVPGMNIQRLVAQDGVGMDAGALLEVALQLLEVIEIVQHRRSRLVVV